jgi:hypothetical protein
VSEIPVEPEDREARVRRRDELAGEQPVATQAAADWDHEEHSDRQLSWTTRLRLTLYLLGLGKGRR